jgi:hypothetical protein
MDAQQIKTLQEAHITAWNERDRTKRDALLTTIYAGEVKMYDKDFILHGNKEISDFIDKVHTDPGFHFSATKPMEKSQNGVRLAWQIQTGKDILTGMDFFVLENDKVLHLYVFMDVNS